MKTIKIWFTDFWEIFSIKNIKTKTRDFYKFLERKYNVIFDDKNPDYLFFSVFGNEHLKYKQSIKIFLLENAFLQILMIAIMRSVSIK